MHGHGQVPNYFCNDNLYLCCCSHRPILRKTRQPSSRNYLIGDRSLGPWITAMAAEASDMSGWLLMGLPGVAYWSGLGEAFWDSPWPLYRHLFKLAIGGKEIADLLPCCRGCHNYTGLFKNNIVEDKKVIMTISALFILVFFSIYAASCFVAVGKLFSVLFEIKYIYAMIFGALFVVSYTFIGGFLAESASDFMQGIVMFFALTIVLVFGISAVGGISSMVGKAKAIPGFFNLFSTAQPKVIDGVQQIENNKPVFAKPANFNWLTIVSTLSWGLGYFGMPQVLVKFMAINKSENVKLSRRIATVWVIISLTAAVIIGISGRLLYPDVFLTPSSSESIFILMSTNFFIPLIAGVVLAGILAATISSADSYLLIAAPSISKNIYQGLFNRDADDKTVLHVTRLTLLGISFISMLIALDENSIIFRVVSFAWAGFGATFGPIMLFSLFWEKTTRAGVIAGMVVGSTTVFIWKLLLNPLGGIFEIYELLPAFVLSCIVIVVLAAVKRTSRGSEGRVQAS